LQEILAKVHLQDYMFAMTTSLIGARLKALRERRKLSQDDLARVFDFRDRQTVSAIETGERRVSAEELLIAVEKLGAPLEYFTDPFMLVGEGHFSWRQDKVGEKTLDAYERVAGRWVAAYRELKSKLRELSPLLRQSLGLTRYHQFEDAMAAGDRFAAEFRLGDVPAARLPEIMEEALYILVLNVDAFKGISGAACRLPELNTVLINRKEVVGRRHFDLAHELFHILTWDAMPPQHSEEATEISKNRVEQLANSFASAVLMPTSVLNRYGDWSSISDGALPARLSGVAEELQVTASALKWRLVAMNRLTRARALATSDTAWRPAGRKAKLPPPPLFSKTFMTVIGKALVEGEISARRAAGLLDLTVDDLGDLLRSYGLESPVDL
jgi:Zn-dependent peptidase ImmA (M78 family)/DNA-binding XRE family transcriptional regulator